MKKIGRYPILVTLLALCIAAGLGSVAVADSLSLEVDPQPATANSVRNFRAIWQQDQGLWPELLPELYTEGWIDYNPTIGLVRPLIPDDGEPTDAMVWFPEMPDLKGFNGFTAPDPADPQFSVDEVYYDPAFVWLQPDPAPTVSMETDGDPKFDHGMDFMAQEIDVDDGLPGVAKDVIDAGTFMIPQYLVDVDGNPIGKMRQRWIPKQKAFAIDPGTPGDTSDDLQIPDLPDMIVPEYSALWVTGVWADQSRTKRIKARIVYLSDLIEGFPDARVITLPDGVPAGYSRVFVSYYFPGTRYIATQQYPLPMPYTVYPIPADNYEGNPQAITKLRINDAILHMDPMRTLPNDPALTPLLGVYDTMDMTGTNFFQPGDYDAPNLLHPGFGVITLTNTPAGGFTPGTTLYVKVSTAAVDSIFDHSEGKPGQDIDYFSDVGGNLRSGAYCSKSGIVKLGQPLPVPIIEDVGLGFQIVNAGAQVWVNYRPLSRVSLTPGRPRPSTLQSVNVHPPSDPAYTFTPGGVSSFQDRFTLPSNQALPIGTFGVDIGYSRRVMDTEEGLERVVWLYGPDGHPIPMFWTGNGTPRAGAEFRIATSAGLNMSNKKQWPSPRWLENTYSLNNKLIYDPRGRPMYYGPALKAKGNGSPETILCAAVGYFRSAGGIWGGISTPPPGIPVTTHDSRSMVGFTGLGNIDYAGNIADRDYLTCYPDTFGSSWPYGFDVDPLSVEPIEEMNPASPDSGSSSTQFVFRVRYHNLDTSTTLPPRPWLRYEDDPWSMMAPTGVVLYLDINGTGDYRPHFMNLEKPEAAADDPLYDVYIYRAIPHHTLGIMGNPPGYPLQRYSSPLGLLFDNESYASLAMGTYHYFFGCSDDSLTFDGGSILFSNQIGAEWGAGLWYDYSQRSSTGTDPSLVRSVAGYEEVARTPKRKYSSNGGSTAFDHTIYVDRQVRVPGFFETTPGFPYEYKWKSSVHPEITCELHMPFADDKFIPFDDESYGSGRFFGTLSDYRRMSNPSHPGTYAAGWPAALAETCGRESNQESVFRVLYKSKYNEAPVSIEVYINDASEKNNPVTGNTPAHTYKPSTMTPRSDQVKPYNYVSGVWYEYKTTALKRGPHTYYFKASDGRHVARYPVRPDQYHYNDFNRATNKIDNEGEFFDWWVPTYSKAGDRGTAAYYDNDYFPGPFVNSPCVLSEPTVTPGTGKEGQQFRYRVKYADPDGQRVYSADLIIEVNDNRDTRRLAMVPETPIVPPPADAVEDTWIAYREMWKTGVYFVLDTATVNDLALQPGVRRYRFEFKDDWGRLLDVNDTLSGELTFYPPGTDNWVSGPIISSNIAPTLYRGSVDSQDGTSNAATLWTWRVTYRDVNNDEPQMIKLYRGLLQRDGRTIVWDEGNTLQKSDPSDVVYSDGADYYFQSRLGAVDTVLGGSSESKQYYYAFEAFDGAAWAAYKSSSKDEQRSNAAGCMFLQGLEYTSDYTAPTGQTRSQFKIRPVIAQQGTVTGGYVSPDNWDDILVTADGLQVKGVYTNEDLTGTDYLAGVDIPNKRLQLAAGFPSGTPKAWINYEARSPVIGPLPVQLPAPVGVMPDALIFENYDTNHIPLLIDDQKNGWISENDPADRSTLVQKGVAIYQGLPSKGWVIPENPNSIGSVEGIYTTLEEALNPVTTAQNYYDITRLNEYQAIMQTWQVNTTINDPNQAPRTILTPIPNLQPGDAMWSDPTRIAKIRGVFLDGDITGPSYYQGNPTLDWQQAYKVGSATVWPKLPDDICSIEGVHTAMDQSLTNYWRADGVSVQGGRPGQLLVKPSDPTVIITLDGIFLDPTMAGANYYDAASANPPFVTGDIYVTPTRTLPADTTDVTLSYLDVDGNPQTQAGTAEIGSIRVNNSLPIKTLLGVYDNVGLTGTNYYDPATGVPYPPGVFQITLTTPMPAGSQIFVNYVNRGFRFAPYEEYLSLAAELPITTSTAYVAYHEPGDVVWDAANSTYRINLETPIPLSQEFAMVWIRPDTHRAGDPIVRTTYDLPIADDAGDRTVWIRYSHVQFTHQIRGEAVQQPVWNDGSTHFLADGWDVRPEPNVHINSNWDDPTAGIIGIWLNDNRVGINYHDPRRTGRLMDDPMPARISNPVPEGMLYLWARCYQNGEYYIDRWNRDVVFLSQKDPLASIQAAYFFGTKMPMALGSNTPPKLEKVLVSAEMVDGIRGPRSASFVFTVKYSDPDGPNGQAPAHVRVYIDRKAYDMQPANPGSTPAYNVGAVYKLTVSGAVLGGGSHKYHFECSDGAAVAWFDANGGHQSYVGAVVDPIKDMDGPWVNDPPMLTNGSVTPLGPVGTNQSFDYFITYTDLDGDAPYFHDSAHDVGQDGLPVGMEYDGSPRLWIDSLVPPDRSYTATVGSVLPDPLDPTKTRKILASDASGWTADQFAGKMMQMTSGTTKGRVYLVQSNTENTLTIATDNLTAEGVVTGDKFRIGGLLMSKVDPSQQDFTLGVQYKITVPRLAVGIHKYHLTARSREDKPQWLIPMLIAQGTASYPYSNEARFPAAGDLTGPTVQAVTQGQPPVISTGPDTSLYLGPKVMKAAPSSATQVDPASPGQVRSVLGVYLNATEATSGVGTSYHDPITTLNPFAPGPAAVVVLSPALPNIHATDALAQLAGLPLAANHEDKYWVIRPDAADRIGTVLGVFLTSDPSMTGTNYYQSAAPYVPGSDIALTSRLPSGTERVYVSYNPLVTSQAGAANGLDKVTPSNAAALADVLGVYLATDPTMAGTNYYDAATANPVFHPGDAEITLTTNLPAGTVNVLVKQVAWPTTYLRHFAQTPSPATYLAGDPLTFRLNYKDPDNDPPTYHDGVQGYIRVVFNNTARTGAMLPLSPPITDYTGNPPSPVPVFSATLVDVPEGADKYHFEASDGYFPVRWPLLGTGGSTANDYPIKVNYKPVIKSGTVDHTSGATTFTFSATYQDKDNTAPLITPPANYGMLVRLIQDEDPTLEYVVTMTKDPLVTSPNYATGVKFIGVAGPALLPGHYTTVFEASDGTQSAAPLPGPSIVVRGSNTAPVIVDFSVTPAAGKSTMLFDYRAFYRDADPPLGDEPLTLAREKGLTLIIDRGTGAEKRVLMKMVPLPVPVPVPPAPPVIPVPDFTAAGGVEYKAIQSGLQLGPGKHTYLVIGRDGTDDATSLMTGTVSGGLTLVTPETASIIESVVGVYTDAPAAGTNYFAGGSFNGSLINLGTPLPAGTTGVYIRYNRVPKDGPVMMVPYFELSAVTKDGFPVTDRSVVGEEILVEGKIFFPYNTDSGTPGPIDNVTLQIVKPDGTSLFLNARVDNIAVDDQASPQNWVGDLVVRYDRTVDPALATGNSLTLAASGLWKISAVWPGDTQWDEAKTDTTIDGRNDIVQLTVSGPSRTIAVADPLHPNTSAMVGDMITPPMVIGSNDPGVIFGYDRALAMWIYRWSPASGAYFRYGATSGVFPPLLPGDAVWIKPKDTPLPYAVEPLGVRAAQRANVLTQSVVQLTLPDDTAAVYGVFTNQNLTGTNYYNPAAAVTPFRKGDSTVTLTTSFDPNSLPAEVWVSYVIWPLSGVDEGWIGLDNPVAARQLDDGEPRYWHTPYRLVKSLSKAYPVLTDVLGNRVLDPVTKLPLLKPCTINLKKGWNQFGNIFFNWKKVTQTGTPWPDAQAALTTVVPSQPATIGKVLGVYATANLTGTNYYVPGEAATAYRQGDAAIVLTTALPAGTTTAYIKHEAYPREDAGIPISEITVSYLGQKKTLAEARLAGWVLDYAWRYDAALRDYVRVHATAAGAERTLKAWSGFWIRAYVDCELEINPNTSYNGSVGGLSVRSLRLPNAATAAGDEKLEMPPPPVADE